MQPDVRGLFANCVQEHSVNPPPLRLLFGSIVTTTGLILLLRILYIWFLADLRKWERNAWAAIASPRWLGRHIDVPWAYIQRRDYRALKTNRLRSFGSLLFVLQLIAALSLALSLCLIFASAAASR
jgi:hypothetical protein